MTTTTGIIAKPATHRLTSGVATDNDGSCIERLCLRIESLCCVKGRDESMPTRPHRRNRNAGDSLDIDDTVAMVRGQYIGQMAPVVITCSCGCRHPANPLNTNGLSKHCADLAWRNAREGR